MRHVAMRLMSGAARRRIYSALLRLYPYDFRAAFAREMTRAAEKPAMAEFGGLLRGAAAEWFAKWTTDPAVRGRTLPDLRMMRPAAVRQQDWFGTLRCSSDTSR